MPDSGFFVGNPDEMRLLYLMTSGMKDPFESQDDRRIILNPYIMLNLAEQG